MGAPKGNQYAKGSENNGRPTKYKKEYCQQLLDYCKKEPYREVEKRYIGKDGKEWSEFTDKANDLPLLSKFANDIGVCHDTLIEWTKVHKDFSETYARAKDYQDHILVTNGLKGLYNPQFSIFFAKNNLGYKDKVDSDVNVNGEMKVNIKLFDE